VKRCAGIARFLTVQRCARPAGLGLQVRDTTEGTLGPRASGFHRQGVSRSLGSQVNLRDTIREERVTGSASGGSETDSGVPASDHESVRGRSDTVKAPRGPRRPKGSPHPRR
jgi:hypothetical protein